MRNDSNIFFIKNFDKYKGQYIITGKEEMKYFSYSGKLVGCLYKEVECPCCHNKRYIRSTLLSPTNKDMLESTLCKNCNNLTEQLFKSIDDKISYTFVNGSKVLIDTEDIYKTKDYNFNINNERVVLTKFIDDIHRKTTDLSRIVMGAKENEVVDHIDHNPLNNSKNNLRIISRKENSINLFFHKKNNSGFKNIYLCEREKKWAVQFKPLKIWSRFENFPDAYDFWRRNIFEKQGNVSYKILEDAKVNLRYSGIIEFDIANGNDIGLTLFVQNCSHHCKGCHNPETWDKNGGKPFTKEIYNEIIDFFNREKLAGRLTLSGGDPLDNLPLSNFVVSEVHYFFPDKKIWVYTGYKFEEIINNPIYWPILETINILVDGPYIESQRDITLPYCGSTNQRVIDVQSTIKHYGKDGIIDLWENKSIGE